jgi:hypothetical protein
LAKGVGGEEVVESVIGPVMGQKFAAFMKIRVDLDELARVPRKWKELSLDAKYVTSIMLGTELGEGALRKWVPLILEMSRDSKEWLVVLCLAMPHEKRSQFFLAAVKMGGDVEQLFKEIGEVMRRL